MPAWVLCSPLPGEYDSRAGPAKWRSFRALQQLLRTGRVLTTEGNCVVLSSDLFIYCGAVYPNELCRYGGRTNSEPGTDSGFAKGGGQPQLIMRSLNHSPTDFKY